MTASAVEVDALPAGAVLGSSRLPDVLNPIFVREIQQSLKGKAFLFTMLLSLVAVVIIAIVVAAESGYRARTGRDAFEATLIVMTPILLVVLPLQAFHSMRHEMRGGTAELLLLSSLTPWRIVRGKLMAAMAHFVLYLAVFAPLIAVTFLLRGVDVVTIVLALVAAAFACLVACLLAIAMGTLTRWRLVAPLITGVSGLVLGAIALPVMIAIPDLHRDLRPLIARGYALEVIGTLFLCGCVLVVLLSAIATSQLTHENENRSTTFRLLGAGAGVAAFVWAAVIASPGDLREVLVGLAAGSAVAGSAFFLFAVTEEEKLSPRVRSLVPRNRRLALLSTPFLPGGGRGLLFTILLLGVSQAIPALMLVLGPGAVPTAWARRTMAPMSLLVALYVLFYAGLGRLIRGRLRPGSPRTWVARLVVPAAVVAASLLPYVPVLLATGRADRWNPLYVLNPIHTIAGNYRSPYFPLAIMAVLCAVMLVLNWRSLSRGVAEVLEASRVRRERAAPP